MSGPQPGQTPSVIGHWFFGDIHGEARLLARLLDAVLAEARPDDVMVFLGDYIDRGPDSHGVVEILAGLGERRPCVFVQGNHELMLDQWLRGALPWELYRRNGGQRTLDSYRSHGVDLSPSRGPGILPNRHRAVLASGVFLYEGDDFLAVHGGIPPEWEAEPRNAPPEELAWVRGDFHHHPGPWKKTVIFGHTPTHHLGAEAGAVWFSRHQRIIGLDTGVAWGGPLSALRWPDERVIQVFHEA